MYHNYSLNLTQNQKKKIANAYKNKTSVSVRLTNASLQLTIKGNVSLQLTSRQINRINKAKASGHGIQINFSKTQLQK